jgi:hypothetical protein
MAHLKRTSKRYCSIVVAFPSHLQHSGNQDQVLKASNSVELVVKHKCECADQNRIAHTYHVDKIDTNQKAE